MRALRLSAIVGLCMLGFGTALFAPGFRQSAIAGAVVPTCNNYDATIYGKSGTIKGTSKADVIVGSDGDDVIYGNGGNDIICGEGGDDTIYGGSGDDQIFGENHTCFGEGGNDTLRGDSGSDYLFDFCGINDADGGSGNDSVDGTGTMKGGSGNDFVEAYGDIYDICDGCFSGLALGGAGNDPEVFVYFGVADGGSGGDAVFAGAEGDEARGGSGNDAVIDDTGGPVTLNGGSGRDKCLPLEGDDTLISCEIVE